MNAINLKFKKLEKKQTFLITSLILLTLSALAFSLTSSNPAGIFSTLGGGSSNFMKDIEEGVKWLVGAAVIVVSLIMFFTKGSRDLNLSEIITHLVVTIIVAWLAANFVAIVTKAAGAEVDTNTKQTISKADNVNNVPEDIIEYVTPLGIVRQ